MLYVGDQIYFKDSNCKTQQGEVIDIDRKDDSAFVRYEIDAPDSVCGSMSKYDWISIDKITHVNVLQHHRLKNGYILDPVWCKGPDGNLRLLEVSLCPAPKENSNLD